MKKSKLLFPLLTLAALLTGSTQAQTPYLPPDYPANIPVNYIKVLEVKAPYNSITD
ncbi:MAG: hypothetical protein JNM68_12615, partial [Dinghuibacter sp.]|nr:hypothetical protein [Dinghuibacter sp.]